jgi:hypothetical protein
MNPSVRLPPVVPFIFQVTAVFVLPVTIAVNCCVLKFATFGALGDTTTETLDGVGVVVTVTVAVPDFVVSFCEMAVIVTCAGLGTDPGAVYSPAADIAPFALPPTTLQFTAWFDVSVTAAVNCSVAPGATLTPVGVTWTEMTFPAVPLLHPARKPTRDTIEASKDARLICES